MGDASFYAVPIPAVPVILIPKNAILIPIFCDSSGSRDSDSQKYCQYSPFQQFYQFLQISEVLESRKSDFGVVLLI